MKGILLKTEQGEWMVRYPITPDPEKPIYEDMYCGESLPLHPTDVEEINKYKHKFYLELDARCHGEEVEFDIITMDNGAMSFTEAYESKRYAKLTPKKFTTYIY
jgi:hypothetical protein